jgi:hypothetical protein
MKKLKSFQQGNGAHCGLSDWYDDNEAELRAALDAGQPFDTGWYSSKKEIASARIRSEDGVTIDVEVFVSDDFDTEGRGCVSTQAWTLSHVADAIGIAWADADEDQKGNAPYVGFSLMKDGQCIEYYLLSDGTYDLPPGDCYHWWGWQHDEDSSWHGQGVPPPDLPLPAAAAFENWAKRWMYGDTKEASCVIGAWSLQPWENARQFAYEDPSDYAGMGWVGQDGRP